MRQLNFAGSNPTPKLRLINNGNNTTIAKLMVAANVMTPTAKYLKEVLTLRFSLSRSDDFCILADVQYMAIAHDMIDS